MESEIVPVVEEEFFCGRTPRGLFGFVFAFGFNQFWPDRLNVTNFMIGGMAASISGMMHAPLTGIFLAAEITGGYRLMVPLMIVAAIAYFINKALHKYSIYTQVLADEGDLNEADTEDDIVLKRMKLKYLIEKDFVVLDPDETPAERTEDIVSTTRNIFPVVDKNGLLCGLVLTDQLIKHIIDQNEIQKHLKVKDLMQPADNSISVPTSMKNVLQIMEKTGKSTLPVIGNEKQYVGFVTKTGIFNYYRSILKRQKHLI